MADNQNIVNNLISGVEFKDSRLASLLQTMANDLYGLNRQINPPTVQSRNLNPGGTVVVTTPTGLMLTLFSNDIRLSWSAPVIGLFLYEIRMGSVYETANVLLTTATLSADIDPVSRFILVGFTYTFWLTSVDSLGNRSTPTSISIAIPNIGAPSLTYTLVGNSVLLKWTAPTSTFTISHYIVYRNGVAVGTINGTFDVIFEPAAGTFEYYVQAVDIVGNLSARSGATTIIFGNPPDFFLFDTITSTFSGSKTNVAVDVDGSLFCNIDPIITWEHHFIDNGWANIMEQIDDGFPLYFEPGP